MYMGWDINGLADVYHDDNPDSFDVVEWVLFDAHTEAVYEAEVDRIYE